MLNGAGRGITEAVNRLLDGGTPEQVREFVATGQHKIRAVDDRVALLTMLDGGKPGPEGGHPRAPEGEPEPGGAAHVRDDHAARAARRRQHGPDLGDAQQGLLELKKAAIIAINGTPADRVEFLKTGQFTARDKDKAADAQTGKPEAGKDGGVQQTVATGTTSRGNTQVTATTGGSGALASTGTQTALIAGGGAAALGAGVGLVFIGRRRRRSAKG